MADAKLNPRQLVDLLHRLDEIEKHSIGIRQHIIEVMAERSRTVSPPPRKARVRQAKR
jgi:hypothetical protein